MLPSPVSWMGTWRWAASIFVLHPIVLPRRLCQLCCSVSERPIPFCGVFGHQVFRIHVLFDSETWGDDRSYTRCYMRHQPPLHICALAATSRFILLVDPSLTFPPCICTLHKSKDRDSNCFRSGPMAIPHGSHIEVLGDSLYGETHMPDGALSGRWSTMVIRSRIDGADLTSRSGHTWGEWRDVWWAPPTREQKSIRSGYTLSLVYKNLQRAMRSSSYRSLCVSCSPFRKKSLCDSLIFISKSKNSSCCSHISFFTWV